MAETEKVRSLEEDRPMTFSEWKADVLAGLNEYQREFRQGERNEFHKKPHTRAEWMGSFARFMSW